MESGLLKFFLMGVVLSLDYATPFSLLFVQPIRFLRRTGKKWKGVEGGGKLFAREPQAKPRRKAAGRSDWIFSGVFDKIGSSGIV